MENSELVLKTLAENKEPLKSGEISQITGLEKKVVDKALKKLKTEELIVSPKRCFYTAK